ncbi:MAG: tRNA guanosine(34) transglycosylase Tgt [bacterium]
MSIEFEILARDGKARTGIIKTAHGDIRTPAVTVNFTPALLRTGLKPSQLGELGVEVVLVNTLHAHRDGVGKVHKFLDWDGPVMADSGGFQMISLAQHLKRHRNGVEFTIDDQSYYFTPEKVLEIQRAMGVDLMMPLDYVVNVRQKNFLLFLEAARETMRWFEQAAKTGTENLYYIVQGGTSSIARAMNLRHANKWLKRGVGAVALGGISLGELKPKLYRTTKFCCDRLIENRPRHLLGVGEPEDLVECVGFGIDTFDCVVATREARHGRLWTQAGILRLTNSRYTNDPVIIDVDCDCPTCRAGLSRAELRAGLKANDPATKIKLMLHNVRFTTRLMQQLRQAIEQGRFTEFRARFKNQLPD